MSVQGTLSSSVSLSHTTETDLATYSGEPSVSFVKQYEVGDITKVWHDSRVLATNETLDVTSGLTDAFGTALNFVTVKGILIYNTHATNTLTVGGGTNPLFTQTVLTGGGSITYCTNITTSGSVKNILLTASASLTYQIIIFGT
jgi:hypothetical protein